jgi:hypothetical protein
MNGMILENMKQNLSSMNDLFYLFCKYKERLFEEKRGLRRRLWGHCMV